MRLLPISASGESPACDSYPADIRREVQLRNARYLQFIRFFAAALSSGSRSRGQSWQRPTPAALKRGYRLISKKHDKRLAV